MFFILLSCSKESLVETVYTLSVSASEGGSVNYDNSNGGVFSDGEQVNISATADGNHYFIGWSDGSRENPIQISVNSDIYITAKFINKLELMTRFEQIVIGDGANGPEHTLRWR
jgi:hypothetical protein